LFVGRLSRRTTEDSLRSALEGLDVHFETQGGGGEMAVEGNELEKTEGTREVGETREAGKTGETREMGETGDTRETRQTGETEETGETGGAREQRKSEEGRGKKSEEGEGEQGEPQSRMSVRIKGVRVVRNHKGFSNRYAFVEFFCHQDVLDVIGAIKKRNGVGGEGGGEGEGEVESMEWGMTMEDELKQREERERERESLSPFLVDGKIVVVDLERSGDPEFVRETKRRRLEG
jgi:RNA recognition motif-containing protein